MAVPFWFLASLFSIMAVVAWRKTMKVYAGRAFPVMASGEASSSPLSAPG